MPQDFDLRINGKQVPVKNGRVLQTFDTANDGFSCTLTTTDKTILDALKPYRYPDAEIYLENELMLTGQITNPKRSKTDAGTVYTPEGFSNTFNFVDSHIIPPYEFNKQNLHQIAEIITKQTATPVVFDCDPGGIFDKVTAKPGQSGFQFLAPLAKQRQQVISSTPQGKLIFQVANLTTPSVGTITEESFHIKTFSAEFDGRKRFKTYKVISQTPRGGAEGLATDKKINQPRHKTVQANNQVAGGIQEIAEWHLHTEIIKALTKKITVIGWTAPNKKLYKSNTLITLVSEIFGVPDGFTFFIREVEYIFSAQGKTAILSLIPNIYTKNPIVEPWF